MLPIQGVPYYLLLFNALLLSTLYIRCHWSTSRLYSSGYPLFQLSSFVEVLERLLSHRFRQPEQSGHKGHLTVFNSINILIGKLWVFLLNNTYHCRWNRRSCVSSFVLDYFDAQLPAEPLVTKISSCSPHSYPFFYMAAPYIRLLKAPHFACAWYEGLSAEARLTWPSPVEILFWLGWLLQCHLALWVEQVMALECVMTWQAELEFHAANIQSHVFNHFWTDFKTSESRPKLAGSPRDI